MCGFTAVQVNRDRARGGRDYPGNRTGSGLRRDPDRAASITAMGRPAPGRAWRTVARAHRPAAPPHRDGSLPPNAGCVAHSSLSRHPGRRPPDLAVRGRRLALGGRGESRPQHRRSFARRPPRPARLSPNGAARLAHPAEGGRSAFRRGRARPPPGSLSRESRHAAPLLARGTPGPARGGRPASHAWARRDRGAVHFLRGPGEALRDRRGRGARTPRPGAGGAPRRGGRRTHAPPRPGRRDRTVAVIPGDAGRGRPLGRAGRDGDPCARARASPVARSGGARVRRECRGSNRLGARDRDTRRRPVHATVLGLLAHAVAAPGAPGSRMAGGSTDHHLRGRGASLPSPGGLPRSSRIRRLGALAERPRSDVAPARAHRGHIRRRRAPGLPVRSSPGALPVSRVPGLHGSWAGCAGEPRARVAPAHRRAHDRGVRRARPRRTSPRPAALRPRAAQAGAGDDAPGLAARRSDLRVLRRREGVRLLRAPLRVRRGCVRARKLRARGSARLPA